MNKTIFYSWQSDLPASYNRTFIENCLKKAIEEVNSELSLEMATREELLEMDKDTKDVPGTPPITDTILEKINRSCIFVGDLTFVGKTEGGKCLPNPNVLIEFGYALRSKSNENVILLMNTEYGEPTETSLPFNIRHLRRPVCFKLGEDNKSEKKAVGEKLVDILKIAIKAILDKQREVQNSQNTNGVDLKEKFEQLLPKAKIVEKIYLGKHLDRVEGDLSEVFLLSGPKAFIAAVPKYSGKFTTKSALDLLVGSNMPIFGNHTNSYHFIGGRNSEGAFNGIRGRDENSAQVVNILNTDGTFVGLDTRILKVGDGSLIPTLLLEKVFTIGLDNCLKLMKNHSEFSCPVNFMVGISGVESFKLAVMRSSFGDFEGQYVGNMIQNQIFHEFEINSLETDVNTCYEILVLFFEKIWSECGEMYPKEFMKAQTFKSMATIT